MKEIQYSSVHYEHIFDNSDSRLGWSDIEGILNVQLRPPSELSPKKTFKQPVVYGSERQRFARGVSTFLVDTILVEHFVHIDSHSGRIETHLIFNDKADDPDNRLVRLSTYYGSKYQELKEKYK